MSSKRLRKDDVQGEELSGSGTTPPLKRIKISASGASDSLQNASVKNTDATEERNGDKIWEILDGDQRTLLEVGVEAPERLILRVRNRKTDEIRTYDYTQNGTKGIDWDNSADIDKIMKYRNQVFNRLKFPLMHEITSWSKSEVAFLTLVREKFALAVQQNRKISLPDNEEIFELFNEEFGGNRSEGSFNNRFRRKDGSRLAHLKRELEEGDLIPEGGPEYSVKLAPGELEAYMEHGHVSLDFNASQVKTSAKRKTSHKENTRKPLKPKRTLGKSSSRSSVDADASRELMVGPLQDIDSPFENSYLRGDPVKIRPLYKPEVVRENWLPSALHSSKTSAQQSDQADTMSEVMDFTSTNETVIESKMNSQTVTTDEETLIINAAKALMQMRTDMWELPEPHIPKREVTGLTSVEQQDFCDSTWIKQASLDLKTRIEKYKPGRYLAGTSNDRNSDRSIWYRDHVARKKRRVDGAATVNALLNTAIVPPLGYSGDVRALISDGLLPDDQLMLHKGSEASLKAFHQAHDDEYEESQ